MSKILIVDDDIKFVNVLSEALLAYRQYEVLTACEPGDEISALAQGDIAIVIFDIDAGNVDGLSFLSFLSTEYPRIPSIVMTRNDHPRIKKIDRSVREGFVLSYMAKPSDLQVIGSTILEGLDRRDENDFASGVPVIGLLHLLESCQTTSCVNVRSNDGNQGCLVVENGTLLDAFCGDLNGAEAVSEMIQWPPLSFQPEVLNPEIPGIKTQRITAEMLEAILTASIPVAGSESAGHGEDSSVGVDFGRVVKLLIVDDSRMMRKVISKIFGDDESIEVVGEAENGKEALEMLPKVNPDVVTLDVQMPVMDGLTTLKHMMIQTPTPTVMLSAFTREGSRVTFDALRYGAVDFVAKPSNVGGQDLNEQAGDILRKVHQAAEVELGAVKFIRTASRQKTDENGEAAQPDKLVVMGAAEGGYGSLLKIIPSLVVDQPVSYLVMLYSAPEHVDSFVDYLNDCSQLPVKRVEHNSPIEAGICYIASGEEYCTVHEEPDNRLVQHVSPAPFASLRGSINMLMYSVAEAVKEQSVGIILSGQGGDGEEGLEEIMRVGGSGVVQDPSSCLYKDMANSALKSSPAARVIGDSEIALQLKNGQLF